MVKQEKLSVFPFLSHFGENKKFRCPFSPEPVYKTAPVVILGLVGKRLDGVTQRCRMRSKIPWLSTQHRHSPLFVSSDPGIWENIPMQRTFCCWGGQGHFWIMKARQILQRFCGSFFFFSPWKDIIPNVVICGLAPTSILQWLLQSEPPFRPV